MSTSPKRTIRTGRLVRLWLGVAGLALAILIAAFLVWALTPLGPTNEALLALESGNGVRVTETDDGWVFEPEGASTEATTGLVFYPGGRVDARSYAPFARELSSRGHVVAIARMPLSLAVLSPDAADAFVNGAVPAVRTWAVGGHSLGGAMAARYAADHEGSIGGLLLLAAYASGEPGSDADMSGGGLAVADVIATDDGVLDQENWALGQALLPKATDHRLIEGGNHAQFGDYGPQPGDNPATITGAAQREQSVDAAHDLLARIGSD